jgi:hypothetical protein
MPPSKIIGTPHGYVAFTPAFTEQFSCPFTTNGKKRTIKTAIFFEISPINFIK